MKGYLRQLAPVLVAGCWLLSVESFTGLTPVAVRRVGAPGFARGTCHVQGSSRQGSRRRCGKPVVAVMAAKPGSIEEKATIDPYVVEAGLVEEDKAV